MTPSPAVLDEADKTLLAVCEFLENPPKDQIELERQRMNLTVQVERVRALAKGDVR